jgi:hypothetical protein
MVESHLQRVAKASKGKSYEPKAKESQTSLANSAIAAVDMDIFQRIAGQKFEMFKVESKLKDLHRQLVVVQLHSPVFPSSNQLQVQQVHSCSRALSILFHRFHAILAQ